MEIVAGHINYALSKLESLDLTLGDAENKISLNDFQAFTSKVILGLFNLNRFLLFWETGSGKTIASIFILKHLDLLYPRWTVLILIKASLRNDPWESSIKKYLPNYKHKIIFVHYDNRESVNQFNKQVTGMEKDATRILTIIDESHNFISAAVEKGTERRNMSIILNSVNSLTKIKGNKLLLISATPIKNSIDEFNVLYKLLRVNSEVLLDSMFNGDKIISYNNIRDSLVGSLSFHSFGFSNSMDETERTDLMAKKIIKYVHLTMSENQTKYYIEAEKEELKTKASGFRVRRKIASTFAGKFDKNTVGEFNSLFDDIRFNPGFIEAFKSDSLEMYFSKQTDNYDEYNYNILYSYSCKFTEACKIILNSPGKVLLYEPFISEGIFILIKYLNIFNIKYLEFSGKVKSDFEIFNSEDNKYGEIVKCAIISTAGSEGISFKCINSLIFLDIPWTDADLRQIMGRALRLQAHKTLPIEFQVVNIYILISYTKTNKSIDLDILNLVKRKNVKISSIYRLFKDCSIESCYDKYPDEIVSEDNYNILDTKKPLLLNQVDVLEKVSLTPVYFTDDEFKTIQKGYRDDSGNIYVNKGKIGIATSFEIRDKKIIWILEKK